VYTTSLALTILIETASGVGRLVAGVDPVTVFDIQIGGIALLPVIIAGGILLGDFARTGRVEELGAWFAGAGASGSLGDAIARALGDASAELLFWLPEHGTFVDADGRGMQLPGVGSRRSALEVRLGEELVGAIVFDAVLIAELDAVRYVAAVAALAVERERLTAQLRVGREALRQSRTRLMAAAERERRRIARDLHDGIQGRLVTLALGADRIVAGRAEPETVQAAVRLREELLATAEELRGLVQGIMPALLIERGLPAAVGDLADRLPIPVQVEAGDLDPDLPDHIASVGYFVVSEALTNAVKHSAATTVIVALRRLGEQLMIDVSDDGVGGASDDGGRGLRGLNDRVDAVGGRLSIESPRGSGTRLRALLPCGS
jgi:signal transduction histidine kinase